MRILALSFRVLGTIALLAGLCRNTSAQDVPSREGIQDRVKVGTRIRITRIDGTRIDGTVVDLSSSSVTIRGQDDPMPTHVRTDDVRAIYKQGRKPWGRNIMIGFGIGAGITAIALATNDHCGFLCGPEFVMVVSSVYGGIGAGVGALVAAGSFGKPILVYERPGAVPPSRFTLEPVITPTRQGVVLCVRF